ncbi:MAG: ATP-dependent sacrificial sulfur transferase LarE [Chthoniobacterales bacterium]
MEEKIAHLEKILRANAPLIVAYSGGVDSACLLAMASRTLGDQALGVIADSPSLPRKALEDALVTAKAFGARVETIQTLEMENPEYTENPMNRCYFCKSELFLRLDRLAEERGFAAIAYGENADDPAHLRPGSKAAAEFKILGPLKAAGLTKADVRELSRKLGLPTADAPAQPCLSSRIPHGTPVTREALELVERGEDFIRSMGFRIFRVRYIAGESPSARVQISPAEMAGIPNLQPEIERGLIAVGFTGVEIDPEGYRSAGG